MKEKMMETIWVYNAKPEDIRGLMKKAGTKIGAVHFLKRKDGALRKMSYRLHVTNPTTAAKPVGLINKNQTIDGVDTGDTNIDLLKDRSSVDYSNSQMTVLDCAKVVYDAMGEIKGRGAWRTVPLETVTQITAGGVRYMIKR